MKHILNVKENKLSEVEETTEELTQRETEISNAKAAIDVTEANETTKANLKASAKAKLIAGEALTEEEANELVGL